MIRIHVREVSFRYASEPVLEGVSLQVHRGHVTALVGPNGTGKSTLLRCIDRILRPRAGAIELDGAPLGAMPLQELARHIAYVPQTTSFIYPTSVHEVVLLGRKPYISWRAGPRDRAVTWEMLARLGLVDMASRRFHELSSGQQQRVLVARALAQEPQVILLDEPTSNLDVRHQLEVLASIREVVQEKQLSALMALHDLNLAARFADCLVLMKGGRVYDCGPPQRVITPENLADVYQISARVHRDPQGLFVVPVAPVAAQPGQGQGKASAKRG